MKTGIYYFTGTGNAYSLAKKLSMLLEDTCILPIQSMIATAKYYQRIGIITPVYATHVPAIVADYIIKTDIDHRASVFVIISFAGSRGYAAAEIRKLIQEKSIDNIQEFPIRMPGNSILDYGAFPDRLQRYLLRRAHKRIVHTATIIRYGRRTKKIMPNLLSVLFQNNSRRMIDDFSQRGSLFSANGACVECGICRTICPVGNISNKEGKPVWGTQCQQCMACIQWCPNNAITHPMRRERRRRYRNPDADLKIFIDQRREII